MEHITYSEVKKKLINLKNDCSSDPDNIPVLFVKPVTEYITSPFFQVIKHLY